MISNIQITTTWFGSGNVVVGYYDSENQEFIKANETDKVLSLLANKVIQLINEVNKSKEVKND